MSLLSQTLLICVSQILLKEHVFNQYEPQLMTRHKDSEVYKYKM